MGRAEAMIPCTEDRVYAHYWICEPADKENVNVKGQCKYCHKVKVFRGIMLEKEAYS